MAVDAGHRHLAVALRDGRLLLAGLDAAGRPHEGTVTLKPSWGHPVAVSAGEDFTLVLTDRHILLAVGVRTRVTGTDILQAQRSWLTARYSSPSSAPSVLPPRGSSVTTTSSDDAAARYADPTCVTGRAYGRRRTRRRP